MSSNVDESGYSVINDTQERLVYVNIYIITTIGLILAILILYSYITNLQQIKTSGSNNNKYYRYAIICGIISCTLSIILYIMVIFFSSDLILPLDFAANLEISTMIDSLLILFWLTEKIACYYAFVFIYTSKYNKTYIQTSLKIIMILVFIATAFGGLLYAISDAVTSSLDEILFGETHNIHVIIPVKTKVTTTSVISAGVVALADFILLIILIYKYYSNKGTKGIVLLCCSFITWILLMIINFTNADIRFLIGYIPIVVDTVCLFLMFDSNQEIYSNLCGCVCGGSTTYQSVQNDMNITEIDQGDESQELM